VVGKEHAIGWAFKKKEGTSSAKVRKSVTIVLFHAVYVAKMTVNTPSQSTEENRRNVYGLERSRLAKTDIAIM